MRRLDMGEQIQEVQQGHPCDINMSTMRTEKVNGLLTFGNDSFIFHVISLIFKYLGAGGFSGCAVEGAIVDGVDA